MFSIWIFIIARIDYFLNIIFINLLILIIIMFFLIFNLE